MLACLVCFWHLAFARSVAPVLCSLTHETIRQTIPSMAYTSMVLAAKREASGGGLHEACVHAAGECSSVEGTATVVLQRLSLESLDYARVM